MYILCFAYSFIHWWTLRLLPFLAIGTMLLWTWEYKYLFKHLFSILWHIHSLKKEKQYHRASKVRATGKERRQTEQHFLSAGSLSRRPESPESGARYFLQLLCRSLNTWAIFLYCSQAISKKTGLAMECQTQTSAHKPDSRSLTTVLPATPWCQPEHNSIFHFEESSHHFS